MSTLPSSFNRRLPVDPDDSLKPDQEDLIKVILEYVDRLSFEGWQTKLLFGALLRKSLKEPDKNGYQIKDLVKEANTMVGSIEGREASGGSWAGKKFGDKWAKNATDWVDPLIDAQLVAMRGGHTHYFGLSERGWEGIDLLFEKEIVEVQQDIKALSRIKNTIARLEGIEKKNEPKTSVHFKGEEDFLKVVRYALLNAYLGNTVTIVANRLSALDSATFQDLLRRAFERGANIEIIAGELNPTAHALLTSLRASIWHISDQIVAEHLRNDRYLFVSKDSIVLDEVVTTKPPGTERSGDRYNYDTGDFKMVASLLKKLGTLESPPLK